MSERDYAAGHNAAWRGMLRTCLRELGAADPDAGQARWVVERTEAVATLRRLCKSQDWPDDLDLSDVIEKHLVKHGAKKQ